MNFSKSGLPVLLIETVYDPLPDNDLECEDTWDEGVPFMTERRCSFRELVSLIEDGGYTSPSSFPVQSPGRSDWLTVPDDDVDFRTGERVQRSLHLSMAASPQQVRYWAKAWRAAGVHFNRGVGK